MCVLSTNHLWIHQCSLYVCSFPQTTYGSTSGHCMCVLFTNHVWINQCSLHVCSFHKPQMDQPVSLHVCSFHKSHMDPLESLLVCSHTKTSTRVIVFVFFSQTTYGSTSVHCMCVLSTNHIWINQGSLHVCSFHKPHMDPPVFIACVFLY